MIIKAMKIMIIKFVRNLTWWSMLWKFLLSSEL